MGAQQSPVVDVKVAIAVEINGIFGAATATIVPKIVAVAMTDPHQNIQVMQDMNIKAVVRAIPTAKVQTVVIPARTIGEVANSHNNSNNNTCRAIGQHRRVVIRHRCNNLINSNHNHNSSLVTGTTICHKQHMAISSSSNNGR